MIYGGHVFLIVLKITTLKSHGFYAQLYVWTKFNLVWTMIETCSLIVPVSRCWVQKCTRLALLFVSFQPVLQVGPTSSKTWQTLWWANHHLLTTRAILLTFYFHADWCWSIVLCGAAKPVFSLWIISEEWLLTFWLLATTLVFLSVESFIGIGGYRALYFFGLALVI